MPEDLPDDVLTGREPLDLRGIPLDGGEPDRGQGILGWVGAYRRAMVWGNRPKRALVTADQLDEYIKWAWDRPPHPNGRNWFKGAELVVKE